MARAFHGSILMSVTAIRVVGCRWNSFAKMQVDLAAHVNTQSCLTTYYLVVHCSIQVLSETVGKALRTSNWGPRS